MCSRCLWSDTAPTEFMQAVFAKMDATLPATATGADVVDETFRAFEEAGPPPGSVIGQGLMDVAVRTIIRTAKRSGVGLNSSSCSPADARRVLKAVAAGQLSANAA